MSTDDAPTPRITGSLAIAGELQRECLDLAEALESRAPVAAPAGRPDLRVAHHLRAVARRVAEWHDPVMARTSPADRERDYHDAATWLAEGRALMRAAG